MDKMTTSVVLLCLKQMVANQGLLLTRCLRDASVVKEVEVLDLALKNCSQLSKALDDSLYRLKLLGEFHQDAVRGEG